MLRPMKLQRAITLGFWVRLFLAMLLCAGSALAQDAGSLRMDLMAQQGQRALRIAKSACLVMSGSQSELHADAATETALEFDATMMRLIDGDAEGELAPEKDDARRQRLEQISRLSIGLTRSSLQIAAGDFHTIPVSLLLVRNQRVADHMFEVLSEAAPTYAPAEQPAEVRNAIGLLQEQHALIEELLRDVCYARLSLGPEDHGAQMIAKMRRFEAVNAALITGDVERGLSKAPNISIKIALGQVDSKWISLHALLNDAATGKEQDVRDVQLASVLGETLTHRMTKLIKMYRKL